MLANIVDIQPKDAGGGGGETRETVVYRLADDMLEKLPPDYVPHEVGLCGLIERYKGIVLIESRRNVS
jgi:hypothetical protein